MRSRLVASLRSSRPFWVDPSLAALWNLSPILYQNRLFWSCMYTVLYGISYVTVGYIFLLRLLSQYILGIESWRRGTNRAGGSFLCSKKFEFLCWIRIFVLTSLLQIIVQLINFQNLRILRNYHIQITWLPSIRSNRKCRFY